MQDVLTTEDKILKAAREVFITKGFEGTRLKDIAEYGGINRGLIEYYYRNKQCLFDSVFEHAFLTYMPKVVDTLMSVDSYENKINKIIDGYFEILSETPYLVDFFFTEIKRNPERFAKNLIEKGCDFSILDTYLSREVAAGNIKPISAGHLMCNILSLVIMPFTTAPLIRILMEMDEDTFLNTFIKDRISNIKELVLLSILP